MNFNRIKKGSIIKINKISEIGSTAVNIASTLFNLHKKKIKLNIIEYNAEIDLSDSSDVLKICIRLLIDQEFSPKFDLNTDIKKHDRKPDRKRKKSKLDIHAQEIVKKINNKITYTQIEKDYNISKTAFSHWRRSRIYVKANGVTYLK